MSANTQVKAKAMLCGEDDSPADVILRIDKDKADLIAAGRKNHDYRYFLLDENVKRIWLFVNQDKAIPYVFLTGGAKIPGEVNDPSGVGNDDFDAGRKTRVNYGYPVLSLYMLPHPLTAEELLEEYGVDMANKRQYVKKALADAFPLSALERVPPV